MQFRIIRYERIEGPKTAPEGGQSDHDSGLRGAGDLVAILARPVAGILDRVFATQLGADCKGCADRQKWLNKALPFPLQTPFRKR
jgi:hypothetical protein